VLGRVLTCVGLALALAIVPARALACATCGAGDPTLTLAGTEQPFSGRVRFSLAASDGGLVQDGAHVSERRLVLGAAWAPVSWAFLSASLPLVVRQLETSSLERETGIGPGDVDLRSRFVVLRDRPFAPTHLVTVQVGARIPIVPSLADASGIALQEGAQTASRTIAPEVGLAWSIYAAPFSLQTYALAAIPTRGSDGQADPFELRAASLAIVQVVPALSLVAGPELRALVDQSGARGGAVLFGTVGAMLGIGDLTPYLLARIPIVTGFADRHVDLPTIEIGAALDV
jgi:hypothetical protein